MPLKRLVLVPLILSSFLKANEEIQKSFFKESESLYVTLKKKDFPWKIMVLRSQKNASLSHPFTKKMSEWYR